MRILIVAPEWPPNVIGGGGAVYERIGRYLVRAGHEVTAAVGNFRNGNAFAHATRRTEAGVDVFRLPLIPTPPRAAWLSSALPPVPFAFYQFDRLLRQPWDVAHLHGVGFPMVDYAGRVLRKMGTPYVFTVHGVPVSPLRRGAATANLMKWYLRTCTAKTIAGAARITAVSGAILENGIIPIPGGVVIHNGIDLDLSDSNLPERHLGIRNPMRLITMSRLSHNKGLDVAIEAVSHLVSAATPVFLDLFGADGGELGKLKALAEQRGLTNCVNFRGPFSPGDRAAILAKYDACLVPSRVEAFGLVALESQTEGLPVIASDREGLREVLSTDSAVLVESCEPKEWAEAILSIMSLERRRALIAGGLRNAGRFLWARIEQQYESELRAATVSR